jgi:hypothetical protein
MRDVQYQTEKRWQRDAGIAIGPILFIIAILAILAAAIAAGSGSFNAPTASEGDKTKASGLISVGENLKIGMDRLTMENGVSWGAYNINSTNNLNDLFSPIGGGISSPPTSLAADPANDVWYYPTGGIPGLGTPNEEQLAMLNVSQGVCDQVNNKVSGFNTQASSDVGDVTSGDINTDTQANWPVNLHGKAIGCVLNAHDSKYYFYEVLYIQ